MSLPVRRISLTALVVAIAAVCTAPAAHAESASTKCIRTYSPSLQSAYKCPLWHSAPVLARAVIGSTKLTTLPAGSSNVFFYQCTGATLYTLGYVNNWWGYVRLPGGQMGYVNEVYFSGGDDWERDGGLPVFNTYRNRC